LWNHLSWLGQHGFHLARPLIASKCSSSFLRSAVEVYTEYGQISFGFAIASYAMAAVAIILLGDTLAVPKMENFGHSMFDKLSLAYRIPISCANWLRRLGVNLLRGLSHVWIEYVLPILKHAWNAFAYAWQYPVVSWLVSVGSVLALYKAYLLGWDEIVLQFVSEVDWKGRIQIGFEFSKPGFQYFFEAFKTGASLVINEFWVWLSSLENGKLLESNTFAWCVAICTIFASKQNYHRTAQFAPLRIFFVPVLSVSFCILVAPGFTKFVLLLTFVWSVLATIHHRSDTWERRRTEQAWRLFQQGQRQRRCQPPAEQARIIVESLPKPDANSVIYESESCIICMDDFVKEAEVDEKMKIATLLCGHQFHTSCISTWIIQQGRCPVCREPVTLGRQMLQTLF
jgi:hypothetical protein